jgi:hypothetical protein
MTSGENDTGTLTAGEPRPGSGTHRRGTAARQTKAHAQESGPGSVVVLRVPVGNG